MFTFAGANDLELDAVDFFETVGDLGWAGDFGGFGRFDLRLLAGLVTAAIERKRFELASLEVSEGNFCLQALCGAGTAASFLVVRVVLDRLAGRDAVGCSIGLAGVDAVGCSIGLAGVDAVGK